MSRGEPRGEERGDRVLTQGQTPRRKKSQQKKRERWGGAGKRPNVDPVKRKYVTRASRTPRIGKSRGVGGGTKKEIQACEKKSTVTGRSGAAVGIRVLTTGGVAEARATEKNSAREASERRRYWTWVIGPRGKRYLVTRSQISSDLN